MNPSIPKRAESRMERGMVLVDKPAGMTSHDVVARLRRIYGQKRIGHAGTLDPDATGLLIVAIGNVTRLLEHFQGKTKKYSGDVVFGIETDSFDSTGAIVSRIEVSHVDTDKLEAALASMKGEVMQKPPIVSALKVDGKRLYKYHRDSQDVEITSRKVRIDSISYSISDEPNVIRIGVVCGPGTYIRSIAHDLGEALGIGAHLTNLRRLESGVFRVEEAWKLDEIGADTGIEPLAAFQEFTVVGVAEPIAARARSGARIVLEGEERNELILFDSTEGPFTGWQQLIGLFKRESAGLYRPGIVLPTIN